MHTDTSTHSSPSRHIAPTHTIEQFKYCDLLPLVSAACRLVNAFILLCDYLLEILIAVLFCTRRSLAAKILLIFRSFTLKANGVHFLVLWTHIKLAMCAEASVWATLCAACGPCSTWSPVCSAFNPIETWLAILVVNLIADWLIIILPVRVRVIAFAYTEFSTAMVDAFTRSDGPHEIVQTLDIVDCAKFKLASHHNYDISLLGAEPLLNRFRFNSLIVWSRRPIIISAIVNGTVCLLSDRSRYLACIGDRHILSLASLQHGLATHRPRRNFYWI